MANKFCENTMEAFAIELLQNLKYEYIYAPSTAPDCDAPERQSYGEVLLTGRLLSAIRRINPTIPAELHEDVFKQIPG